MRNSYGVSRIYLYKFKMSVPPQSLRSSSINPANLLELQVLTKVITQLQSNNDIRGSIPYLAKIVQIVEHQKLDRPSDPTKQSHYYQQLNELRKVKADAYAQLADAYFQTQQYILCESSLLVSVKLWENLVRHDALQETGALRLAYEQLKICYEQMGKIQLAQHMETKLSRLTGE
jgi:hypothetical protein